jgi:hypothetical protein
MQKHLTVILCLALLGLALGGCSKCGDWPWEQNPRSCHSAMPR